MKFHSIIFASLLASVFGQHASEKDEHHLRRFQGPSGPKMWVFGNDGVRIFSPDGSDMTKSIPANDVCHPTTGHRSNNGRSEDQQVSCSWWAAVSDGKKYVWVAVSRGVPKIDVFSIDTGDMVGAFETCNNVRGLEYHPLRDEIWVRCGNPTDSSETYMDVFSASSPSATIQSRILLHENTTLTGYGGMAIDNSLGDVGYSTLNGHPYVYKIDLSSRTILDKIETPSVWGLNDMSYSRVNRHMYFRTQVCCSCGFPGADKEECGRYAAEPVNVVTGPNAGQTNVNGQCGRCDGTQADTIGIYEFDINSEKVISRIFSAEGSTGIPAVSPSGEYIVIFGRNGGSSIRILRAGGNGVPAQVAYDIKLDFHTSGFEDFIVFNDFAFVQDRERNRNIFVLSSRTENKVALVDLAPSRPEVSYVLFKEGNSTARASRQVEWARGTDYVWIDGAAESEVYVIDVSTKRLVKTITDIHSTRMLSVTNFERLAMMNFIRGSSSSTTSSVERASGVGGGDSDSVDGVSIAAIVLAVIAILVGVVNLAQKNAAGPAPTKKQSGSAPSVTSGANSNALMAEEMSLGSKDVN